MAEKPITVDDGCDIFITCFSELVYGDISKLDTHRTQLGVEVRQFDGAPMIDLDDVDGRAHTIADALRRRDQRIAELEIRLSIACDENLDDDAIVARRIAALKQKVEELEQCKEELEEKLLDGFIEDDSA